MMEGQARKTWVYLLETVLLAAADILIIFVIFLSDALADIVGLDYVVYEDWEGRLASQVHFRLGAGCIQYTFEIIKTVLFIVLHVKLNKKYNESAIRLILPGSESFRTFHIQNLSASGRQARSSI